MHRMLLSRLEEMRTTPPVTKVLGARTPDEAMKHVADAAPGPLVVVTDFNLKASRNGLQLLSEVRRARPDALRVLFSGYSLEQLGDVQGSGDADAFLEKPLLLDELIAPLEKLVVQKFG